MAKKKKTKKKATKSSRKVTRKKPAAKIANKKAALAKPAKKKASKKKAAVKRAPATRRATKPSRPRGATYVETPEPTLSGRFSGDMQGISSAQSADSESVEELLEEGNTFEAGVVSGVEHARSEDGKEVHTHEVPEDDVPQEYLDKE